MITPELMVAFILFYMVLHAVVHICLGAIKAEKDTHYGNSHIADGVAGLLIVMLFLLI